MHGIILVMYICTYLVENPQIIMRTYKGNDKFTHVDVGRGQCVTFDLDTYFSIKVKGHYRHGKTTVLFSVG